MGMPFIRFYHIDQSGCLQKKDSFVSGMINDQNYQGDFKNFLNMEIKEKGPAIVPGASFSLMSTVISEYQLLSSDMAQDKGPRHLQSCSLLWAMCVPLEIVIISRLRSHKL